MSEEFVTTKVTGLDKLQAALEKLSKEEAKDALHEALEVGAITMHAHVVQEAPRDTGFLDKHFNIKYRIRAEGLTGSAFIGPQGHMAYPLTGGTYAQKINKSGRKYKSGRIPVVTVARFLEFGTAKMAANPFITRAFESTKQLVISRIVDVLKKRLKV